VTEYAEIEPYWFVSKYDRTYAEGVYQPLYDYNALFLAKAYILEEPYDELVKNLDVPAFYRGDLFYIQNLVAALTQGSLPNAKEEGPPVQYRRRRWSRRSRAR
jgi:hypothetical protein